MGIAIANLALAYRLSGSEQYLQDAKRFMNTVLSYEKWGNAHLAVSYTHLDVYKRQRLYHQLLRGQHFWR